MHEAADKGDQMRDVNVENDIDLAFEPFVSVSLIFEYSPN